MHYHAGNYYNLPAAVASNDLSAHTTNYETLPNSICPRGWRIPKGPESSSSSYSDFDYLLAAYNIKALGSLTYLSGGFNNIRVNPLYLVRAGVVVSLSYSAYDAGNRSDYWLTNNIISATKARGLNFTSSDFVIEGHNRYDGKSIRCIADNRINYSLNYAPNGDNVSGVPNNQLASSESSSHTFTTSPTIPTRTGHNFLGYATSADGEVVYQPGASISLNSSSPSITLYAKWGELGFNNSGITTMQAMTPAICTAASQGTTGLLQDTRDGKVYSIFKGNDNKCWMSQNLDLNLSTGATLNNTNTDLNSTTSWTPARDTIAPGGLSSSTWQQNLNNPYSYAPGPVYFYTSNTNANDIQYNSLAQCASAGHSVSDCQHYHAGTFYNWSATVASNDTSVFSTIYTQVPDSICPRGWRLPRGQESSTDWLSEFNHLLAAHGIIDSGTSGNVYLSNGFNNMRANPLFLTRSGVVFEGSHYDLGSRGWFWTHSLYSNTYAYRLYFTSDFVGPQDAENRGGGYSVRCLANSTNHMYYLGYNPNGSNVSNLPAGQVVRNDNTSHTFTISSTAPTRANYIFQGYATSADGTVAYQPGNTISTTSSAPTITIYAKWEPMPNFDSAYAQAGKSKWNGYYTMQDMTTSICSTVTTGEQATLIDTRDSKTYGVFKANDGRCWMRQNLDLNLSSSVALTNVNTDLNDTNSWAPTAPYGARGNTIAPGGLLTGWLNNGNVPFSYDIGNSYDGNLYNWAAAAATNWGAATTQYTIMPNSICPKGWRLPLGPVASGDVSDFADLLSAHGVANPGGGYIGSGFNGMTSNPLSFVRAGYVEGNGGTHYNSGTVGRYWTSVFHSDPDGYMLIFDSGGVYPNTVGKRHQGASVRCVAR